MASAIYPIAAKAFLDGDIDLLTDNIKCVLIDSADYTYSSAHDFLDDVAAGARVATSGNLSSKTTTGGTFDAADFTFSSVTGDASEALIYYKDSGVESTSNLICFVDGISVTPNGGDIDVAHDAAGIFSLV